MMSFINQIGQGIFIIAGIFFIFALIISLFKEILEI